MTVFNDEQEFRAAADAIRDAEALLITAGAGMGVDSGLPDFRGTEGFWKAYPPLRRLNLSFIDMANPEWFHSDPEQAWGFYGHRLNLYRETAPHDGFALLRNWGERAPGGCFVFTSNVDGHFQKAGFSETQIVECHGSIRHLQCSKPCNHAIWPADNIGVTVAEETFRAKPPLPLCASCGAVSRPNILMFGDAQWLSQRTHEQDERYVTWLRSVNRGTLVVIECGAGTAVPTVRYESERQAGLLIRINPREHQTPAGHLSLRCGTLEAVQRIARLLDQ